MIFRHKKKKTRKSRGRSTSENPLVIDAFLFLIVFLLLKIF